jgi:hypothetical protein
MTEEINNAHQLILSRDSGGNGLNNARERVMIEVQDGDNFLLK